MKGNMAIIVGAKQAVSSVLETVDPGFSHTTVTRVQKEWCDNINRPVSRALGLLRVINGE